MEPFSSVAPLTSLGAGYAPFATGLPPRRPNPFEGVPFLGNTGFGQMVSMALLPTMYRGFGQYGMVPMGMQHDQNVYDRIRSQQFAQAQMQAMQDAAIADRDNFNRTLRGMAALTGTPFDIGQRRAAHAFSSSMAGALPFIAPMAPDFFDQIGGSRGSAVVMAGRVMEAGRYRIDPVTGQMGMSAASVGRLSRSLYNDLFDDRRIGQMRGVTAGQVGSLFHELQMRGMIGTGMAEGLDQRGQVIRALGEVSREQPNEFARIIKQNGMGMAKGIAGISATDLDKLTMDPAVSDKLRSFDGERIKRSVKSYINVVSAMRDIFGDLGRPNAPMNELVAGIEALTAGSMAQIDPGRLTSMVRQTHNLAKQTGVTIENALALQQHAAARGTALGLEPAFAVQAAQGAMAFGGAYRALGIGSQPFWGGLNESQSVQLNANLRQQAAASNEANRIAAVMRISENVGGFGANTMAGRYVEAVKAGLTQFQTPDGQWRSLMMSGREFNAMLTGAVDRQGLALGLSENDVLTTLGQRDVNREYGFKNNAQDLVTRMQPQELRGFVSQQMQFVLRTRLRDQLQRQGLSSADADAQARSIAANVSGSVVQRVFQMSPNEVSNTATRNKTIGGIIQDELAKQGAGGLVTGPGRDAFMGITADQFYGAASQAIRANPAYSGLGNLGNAIMQKNAQLSDATMRQQMQAMHRGQIQDDLSGMAQGSMLRRIVDAVQNTRPTDAGALSKVVLQAIGGVETDAINKALVTQTSKLYDKQKQVEELQRAAMNATDPAAKKSVNQRLEAARAELRAEVESLRKIGEPLGMDSADTVRKQDTDRAMDSLSGVQAMRGDLTGLAGGFGTGISAAQLAALRGRAGTSGSDAEVSAVLGARNQTDIAAIAQHISGGNVTKLTDRQRQLQAVSWQAIENDTVGMKPRERQEAALAWLRSRAGDANLIAGEFDSNKKSLTIGSDAEARALGLAIRRETPLRAGNAEIQQAKAQYPQEPEAKLRELAETRLRAKRLGIDESDWRGLMKGTGLQAELAAIQEAFAVKGDAIYGPGGPRKEELDKRFRQFWAGEEGTAAREAVTVAMNDVENVADRLIRDKKSVRRFGTQATDMAERLRKGQEQLYELASRYTKGDVASLLAGTFKAGSAKEYRTIRAQTDAIIAEQKDIVGRVQGLIGQPGKQFQADDVAEAKRLLGIDPAKTPTAAEKKQIDEIAKNIAVFKRMTPDQEKIASEGTAEQIAALEKELGVGAGGISGVKDVMRRLDETQKSAADQAIMSGSDLTKKIFEKFGYAAPSGLIEQESAALLEGPQGRVLGRRILESSEGLERIARRTGGAGHKGIDEMLDAYVKARKGSREELLKFQQRYGFDVDSRGMLTAAGTEDWNRFERDYAFQQQTGLLSIGHDRSVHRTKTKEEDLRDLIRQQTMTGGRAGATGSGEAGTQHLDGTLKIYFENEPPHTGKLSANSGGSRSNPAMLE